MEFYLITKKINNTLTKEEAIIFNQWFSESEKHRDYFFKVKNSNQLASQSIDKERGWMFVEKRIAVTKKRHFWKYASMAAAITLLISTSFFILLDKKNEYIPEKATDRIQKRKAILTLSNGIEIPLEKGKIYENAIVKSDGSKLDYAEKVNDTILQKEEIAYNYLTTQRGGEFFLNLEDGTKVWLNSDSKLKYPTKFLKGKTRAVELVYGEAYFEVSPSTKHNGDHFKVLNKLQEIEVLGTKFNVKAYKNDKNIITTLKEGKVLVKKNEKSFIYLKPNEQLILNKKTLKTLVKEVDVDNEISWINGAFNFKDMTLKEISKVLSRWYDVDVTFENKEVEKTEFNGVINKDQDINFVLKEISSTSQINFKIKNRNIFFKKEKR